MSMTAGYVPTHIFEFLRGIPRISLHNLLSASDILAIVLHLLVIYGFALVFHKFLSANMWVKTQCMFAPISTSYWVKAHTALGQFRTPLREGICLAAQPGFRCVKEYVSQLNLVLYMSMRLSQTLHGGRRDLLVVLRCVNYCVSVLKRLCEACICWYDAC